MEQLHKPFILLLLLAQLSPPKPLRGGLYTPMASTRIQCWFLGASRPVSFSRPYASGTWSRQWPPTGHDVALRAEHALSVSRPTSSLDLAVDDKHPLHTRLQHALIFDWDGKKSGQADSLPLCGCRTHVALVSCQSPGMLQAYNQGCVPKKSFGRTLVEC
jgi:hypothetical protein